MKRRRMAERKCPKCGRVLPVGRFHGNSRCDDCHRYGSPEAARKAAKKRMRKVGERKKQEAKKKRRWRPPSGAVLNQLKNDWSNTT